MSNKQAFISALEHKKTGSRIPLWELHFHLWNKFDTRFVTGPEFDRLPDEEKAEAIKINAHIMKEVGERLGFGCVSIPDAPWDCVYTLPQEYRCMLVCELKALSPDFCIIAGCGGVFSMPASADDYLNFCYWIIDEPEEVDVYCEKIYAEFELRAMELINAGVDAIYIPADIADNRTTFISRSQLERWYFPYLKRNVEFLHNHHIFAILHTDGNVNSILDALLDCNIDGLQAIDPIAGMNMVDVLNKFDGRAVACGNLDCGLMLSGTAEEVYESARQILRDCKGKALVFGNSNAVVPETPVENYMAMHSAWVQFG